MGLQEKIASRKVKVAVLGLGYVGLPLALEFAKAKIRTLGIDVDEGKVGQIAKGISYIPDVPGSELKRVVSSGHLAATSDFSRLSRIDAAFICVPTPFTRAKDPDIHYIIDASQEIARYLHPEELIILQSTTYPGTTEEEVLPILEGSGLKAGVDFYLAFSPERIDPGNKRYGVKNTPKVVGGLTPRDTEMAASLFSLIIEPEQIHRVSCPRSAEMCKLLENIFRSVNIALVNELTKLADRMKIDIWEVIEAASTKPFGFMPFYPGPGVGGHCIPVDPYYLSWKAREYDFYTKFIELAAEVNQSMPHYTVNKVIDALNRYDKPIKGANILVLGAAFKRDIDDPRNSPSLELLKILDGKGAKVCYHDPYIPEVDLGDAAHHSRPAHRLYQSRPLTEKLLSEMDCVVIAVHHSVFDIDWIVKHSALVVDAQNATRGLKATRGKVFKI
ncbi:MAG: nucleotide sugar dehydrogenase [candidate division NC10 bacterium]|nr:nucleotide sugar dehydrogenase [candidate division NC10 bacterium]